MEVYQAALEETLDATQQVSSPVCKEEAASEVSQVEQDKVQEVQVLALELVDIKAIMEITPAVTDTGLNFTAPLGMAMVLAAPGPIPASEDTGTTS